jgi:hypothetical protein
MAVGPDGIPYTYNERRQEHLVRLMTSQPQTELNLAFDAADMTRVLSYSEKLSDPALSLLAADTAGARTQAHQIETVFSAIGTHLRNLLDGSPLTKLLISKNASMESGLIVTAVPLILLGELAWRELTATAAEQPLHPAVSAIKGDTAGIDWTDLYRNALQTLGGRKFYLKAQGAGIALCYLRHGYIEASGYFDTALDADIVKAILPTYAHAAFAYLAAFEAMMRYPKLKDLPVHFVGEEYKAAERWTTVFNNAIEPEHLRILSGCVNKTDNHQQ